MKPAKLSLPLLACVLFAALPPRTGFGLGADHPKGEVSSNAWPKGMSELVNSPRRIHGYFVNAEDVFFFAGDQRQFNEVLEAYAKIEGLVRHRIVVHEGKGRAGSPWQKSGDKPCDWMIYGCPALWKRGDGNAKGYVLEIHVWKEGKIRVDAATVPDGITVEPAADPAPPARN